MEKESLNQIEMLESLLKEGISIINGEINVEDKDLVEKYLSSINTLSHEEQIKEYDKLLKAYDGLSEQSRLIASIARFSAKRGGLKKQYFEKMEILFKQELLNNKLNKIMEVFQLSKEIEKIVQISVLAIDDIEIKPIIPLIEGLYWDVLISQDSINLCNNEIKCFIRNKYFDMADSHIDSILQRNISLNSKKLAIMNYMKQVQDKCALLAPYEIGYKVDYEKYTGRKCDKKRLENKKRN